MTVDEFEAMKSDVLKVLNDHPAGLYPTQLNKRLVEMGHSRPNAKATVARLWDAGILEVGGGLLVTLANRSRR